MVGEAVERVELLLQGLCIGPRRVRPPEADDRVGHPHVLETMCAVDRERVERDHVDVERVPLAAVLGAELVQTREHPRQLLAVTSGMDPAVALPGGAPERRVGVTAYEDRDGLRGYRTDLAPVDLQYLTVVFEPATCGEPTHDVDRLVHAEPAPFPRQLHRGE